MSAPVTLPRAGRRKLGRLEAAFLQRSWPLPATGSPVEPRVPALLGRRGERLRGAGMDAIRTQLQVAGQVRARRGQQPLPLDLAELRSARVRASRSTESSDPHTSQATTRTTPGTPELTTRRPQPSNSAEWPGPGRW